jgi:hypothetical protein
VADTRRRIALEDAVARAAAAFAAWCTGQQHPPLDNG